MSVIFLSCVIPCQFRHIGILQITIPWYNYILLYVSICVFVYLCNCILVYYCTSVLLYFCPCVLVYYVFVYFCTCVLLYLSTCEPIYLCTFFFSFSLAQVLHDLPDLPYLSVLPELHD